MKILQKDILTFSLFCIVLFAIIISFSASGNFVLLNFMIIPIILALMIYETEMIIALYLIVLPTAGIIPSDYNLFEIFGIDEFINISIIGFFLFKSLPKYKKSYIQNFAISLIVLMMLIMFFTVLKNYFFNIYSIDGFTVIKRTFFILLKHIPLILIIFHIRNFKIRKFVYIGLYLSGVLIVISQFFNAYLSSIGLVTFDETEFAGLAANISQVNRFAGFYNGDPNSAGAYLLMIIGFMFIKIEKRHQLQLMYSLVLIFLAGILMTASRTIFVAFFLVLILFAFNNKSNKASFQILLFLTIGVFFMSDFIFNQISRFHNAHYQVDTELDGNRIMKWVFYIQFMLESPFYFVTGSQTEINNRAAHNVFVQTLFNVGIAPLIVLISKFHTSILILIKKSAKSLYFMIPFFCIIMFVGELKEIPLYALLIVLFYLENYKQININF